MEGTPQAPARLGPRWARGLDFIWHSAVGPEKGTPRDAKGRESSWQEPGGWMPWQGNYRSAGLREPRAFRKAARASARVARAAVALVGPVAAQGNTGLKTGMIGEIVDTITVIIAMRCVQCCSCQLLLNTCLCVMAYAGPLAITMAWAACHTALKGGMVSSEARAAALKGGMVSSEARAAAGGIQARCAGLKVIWLLRTSRTSIAQSRDTGRNISAWRLAPTPIKVWLNRMYVYIKHNDRWGNAP